MPLPNFLIVGAAKAGTTALCEYLSQHPDIFMSQIKEPNFFATENGTLDFEFVGHGIKDTQDWIQRTWTVTSWDAYQTLFDQVTTEQAIGEASTIYLYSPKAPYRINAALPQAKIITFLRHPVDRAYSHFLFRVRQNQEPLENFEAALAAEPDRIAERWGPPWHYRQRGLYYMQVKRYLDVFGADQCQFFLFDELKADVQKLLKDIFVFLDVDPNFTPNTSTQYNLSGIPKNQFIQNLLQNDNPIRQMAKRLVPVHQRRKAQAKLMSYNLKKPPLSPDLRQILVKDYREDILKLQDLLNRDLSVWL